MTIRKILGTKPSILIFACLMLIFGSCVEFKKITLYDGVVTDPPIQKPKSIGVIVEPVIFEDDETDVWGLEVADCTTGSISREITRSGNKALHFVWDRNKEGCIWAGFGIGWDGYAGKDLTGVMDFAAIEFYVRSEKGKMYGLPIVLTLEDYSGGMGFSYTDNKYFERSAIDEDWQRVVVPLNTFDIKIRNLDITNIKSLNLELQQSGSIYLDDIHLVFYEPEPQEPWLEEEPLENPLTMPKQLFDDDFINNNGWGFIKDECQDLKISDVTSSEGEYSIHAKWDNKVKDNCGSIAFGVSWAKWHPVDLSASADFIMVQFDIKNAAAPSGQLPIKVGFEDYDRAISGIPLLEKYVSSGSYNDNWNRVSIPFYEFKGSGNNSKLKYLGFWFENSGEVFIDNIQLVSTDPN